MCVYIYIYLYTYTYLLFVVQSLSCVNSLRPLGLQHIRFLCPPLSPGVCSDSCPLCWRCYLTISSSAALFSFCLQRFPALWSFPVSRLFASGGQSTRASASVLPVNFQGWFRLDWFNLLAVQGILKSLQSVSYLGFCCCCCCCSFVLFYFTNKWKHTVFVFLFLI